jgi:hypothetical protein
MHFRDFDNSLRSGKPKTSFCSVPVLLIKVSSLNDLTQHWLPYCCSLKFTSVIYFVILILVCFSANLTFCLFIVFFHLKLQSNIFSFLSLTFSFINTTHDLEPIPNAIKLFFELNLHSGMIS